MCGQGSIAMLSVSPLRSSNALNSLETGGTIMESNFSVAADEFPEFSGANLLDSIDFDDLFMGMHDDDMLPDLEMDPELLAEFSISGVEDSEANHSSASAENVVSPTSTCYDGNIGVESNNNNTNSKFEKLTKFQEGEIESKKKDPGYESSSSLEHEKGINNNNNNNKKHKPSSTTTRTGSINLNTTQGKRKTKVDWTPELHRKFVEAVEQLGVDKAVPSRILELMGIHCLTRHNIASHLQKYRSHRKHLLAREAEAASWTQKRHIYGGNKAWHPPTFGFPPINHHPFTPLHVWGHPQTRLPIWPNHGWASHPPPPPPDPSLLWHSPHHRRVGVPPVLVPGVPPHPMYRPDQAIPPPVAPPSGAHTPLDHHPSKESIDAALGDVLSKPWLPLPIGLKPPSTETVFTELHRQGVSKIPPSCA